MKLAPETRPDPFPPDIAERAMVDASAAARGFAGCVLRNPKALDDDAAGVEPDDLLDAFARDAFSVTRDVFRQSGGKWADAGVVADKVIALNRWDRGRVMDDLTELMSSVSAVMAQYFADRVKAFRTKFQLNVAAHAVARAADEAEPTAEGVAEATAAAWVALEAAGVGKSDRAAVAASDAITDGLLDFRRRASRDAAGRLGTGFADLDKLVPSLDPGQLVVVGARPSVGKTALGLAVASYAAAGRGVGVHLASLEMSREEIGQRLAVMTTGADAHALRSGRATPAELAAVELALGEWAAVPLWVDDTSGLRVGQIAASARRTGRRLGLGLVVVDYLQLVAADNGKADRREQVEQVSRGLKRMARQLSVPVIAMAQLNREVEGRPDGKPRLADLREAGGIEQDADVVMLLWRFPGQSDDAPVWRIGCSVAKQRNGPTGDLTLAYRRASMRFENMAPEW